MTSTIIGGISRTNRRFFLLGACGILALTVIQVANVADLWEQARSQQRVQGELVEGLSTPNGLSEVDEQIDSVRAELTDFELSMVGMDLMPTIQSELMEMARASGCQLRKAVIQSGSTETWEPLTEVPSPEEIDAELADPAAMSMTEQESPYRLSTEILSLSLSGTLKQTFDFLDRIREKKWLMRVATISFSRDVDGTDQLGVEASLAFHKLVCHKGMDAEGEAPREGSRSGMTN